MRAPHFAILLIFITSICVTLVAKPTIFSPRQVGAGSSFYGSFEQTSPVATPVTPTPIATPTPVSMPTVAVTVAVNQPPLQLQQSAGGQCSYKPLIEDAKRLNIPITPVPLQGTSQYTKTALSPLNSESSPAQTVEYLPELGITARLDGYAFDAADYLKDHQQEGAEGLRRWLNERDLLCTPGICSNNLISDDFNKDGRVEYILTLTPRKKPFTDLPSECGSDIVASQRVYMFSCQTNPNACEVYRIGRLAERAEPGGCINPVADMNNDGLSELLVTYSQCGASDCWNRLEIVGLSNGYRYLAPKIEVHNGCIAANDENGDGKIEIFASTTDHPGVLGSLYDSSGKPAYGPVQRYVSIYQWHETKYVLSGRAYSHNCLFHLIWDGIDWVKRGEIQTALLVFEIALENQSIPTECKSEDNIPFPWKTYAQFAVGMLNAKLGHSKEASIALMKVKDMDSEEIFTPLVDVFVNTYSMGDFEDACDALTTYIDTLPNDASFRGPYRHRQTITFCPNDMPE